MVAALEGWCTRESVDPMRVRGWRLALPIGCEGRLLAVHDARVRYALWLRELMVPPDIVNDMSLVAGEALNNSAKHSRCTMLTLTATALDGCTCFVVSDNGHGFDPRRLHAPDTVRECGRGIIIMMGLADTSITTGADGTTVRARRDWR